MSWIHDQKPGLTPVEPDELAGQLRACLQQLQHTLATMNGARLAGAVPREITNGTSQAVSSSPGRLAGYSFRETTGSNAAVVRLRDGVDATGQLLATVSLANAESVRDWFGHQGVGFSFGLYVEIVSGAVEGVAWLGAAR